MSYAIALNFEDGVTRFIDCKVGEKVLDAAFRQRINLPMDCSDGVCGTCKCHCETGAYDLGDDYIDDALSADEARERQVLNLVANGMSNRLIGEALGITTGTAKAHVERVIGKLEVADRTQAAVRGIALGLVIQP